MRYASDPRRGHAVVNPQQKEKITYALWHRQAFVSAATVQLVYFNVGVTGVNGNVPPAGQLQSANSFLVQSIRICPQLQPREAAAVAAAAGTIAGPIEDMFQIINTGTATFKVGDKEYGRWPIWMMPAGGGVGAGLLAVGAAEAAGAIQEFSYAVNGSTDPRQVYSLQVPILIPPQYSFSLTLDWAAAITLTGFTTSVFVTSILDGTLIRPAQ